MYPDVILLNREDAHKFEKLLQQLRKKGNMAKVIAVYRRHETTCSEDFEYLSAAALFLHAGSADGNLFPVGIYDTGTKKAYIEECRVVGVGKTEFTEDLLADLRAFTPDFDNREQVTTLSSFEELIPRGKM